jgi:hypothetical protein
MGVPGITIDPKSEIFFVTTPENGANTCYLAVFKSQVIATETWFVGNVFMRDYYVVYDMTPKDSRKLSYI